METATKPKSPIPKSDQTPSKTETTETSFTPKQEELKKDHVEGNEQLDFVEGLSYVKSLKEEDDQENCKTDEGKVVLMTGTAVDALEMKSY